MREILSLKMIHSPFCLIHIFLINGKDRIFLIVVHDQTCDADCGKLKADMASLAPPIAQQDMAALMYF